MVAPKKRDPEPVELDELTLRRAQRGDPAACRDLVILYQARIFAYLSRAVPRASSAVVEELAQETFLSVFRSLPRFHRDGPARLSTWILTIAARRAIDHARKPRVETAALDEGRAVGTERSDRRAREGQIAARVHEALSRLEPEFRSALILRVFYDMDYAEIATALDIEIGTVKSRIARARSELSDIMKEEPR